MDAPLRLPPINVAAILRSHGLAPKKGLGQNFLVDPSALERIVQAAEISPGSVVLEVGPGLGSLTRYLALAASRVVAVELDAALIPAFEYVLSGQSNVEIVHADILKINPADLIAEDGYLVVANIPYYITSNLIRHLLESPRKPGRIVLTVQREVAERIAAPPGGMSYLSVFVQYHARVRVAFHVPADAFEPEPAVESAVIVVEPFADDDRLPDAEAEDALWRLVQASFRERRKMLHNVLSRQLPVEPARVAAALDAAGIAPDRRPQTVAVGEWLALLEAFGEIGPDTRGRRRE
jgi:16S rRNA (adenine1518-N6/adenine1519-N6)-dimethyltransferase